MGFRPWLLTVAPFGASGTNSEIIMGKKLGKQCFAICTSNEGCDDLEVMKVYRLLPDARAAKEDFLRIVDPTFRILSLAFRLNFTPELCEQSCQHPEPPNGG